MQDQRSKTTLRLCSGQEDQRPGIRKKTKAQSVLESTVAYAAVMAVLGGAMGVFGWGIAHIPARQATYEATRIISGSPGNRDVTEEGAQETTSMAVWPTYLAGGGIASAF